MYMNIVLEGQNVDNVHCWLTTWNQTKWFHTEPQAFPSHTISCLPQLFCLGASCFFYPYPQHWLIVENSMFLTCNPLKFHHSVGWVFPNSDLHKLGGSQHLQGFHMLTPEGTPHVDIHQLLCPATLYKVGTPNCSFRHAGGLWSR